MKKRISKRFLSMLLVLVMVLSVLPMAAMAAEFKSLDVDGDGADDINVAFGAELDPNTVLDANYDIKAVGAVLMDYAAADKNLVASGEIELYVPFSIFEDTINDALYGDASDPKDGALEKAVANIIDPAVQTYLKNVDDYLDMQIHYVDTVEAELYPDPDDYDNYIVTDIIIDITADNLAELIEIIRSGKQEVKYEGVVVRDFYYYEIFETAENALCAAIDYAVTEVLDMTALSYNNVTEDGIAYKNWVAAAADPNSDAAALANTLVATLGLKYAQEKYDNETVKLLIQNIPLGDENGMFKDKERVATEIEAEVYAKVAEMTGGYVDDLLADIKDGFYGELAEGETLTSRFDGLQGIVDTFLAEVSTDFAEFGVAGIPSVNISLPSGAISTVEGMLKELVANMNGVTNNGAANEQVGGRIIGSVEEGENKDALKVRTDVGLFVVAGVNSLNFDDQHFDIYFNAPDVVPVTILADGSDMGYFLHRTVGEDYEITSTVANGYDAENLMKLRIAGVETDGGTYDSAEEPTNAGVYTVFSFYFDKSTLAMGGDVAVLVVEPKDTPTDEFKFEDDLTVDYDGAGHFPSIVNTNNHMSVAIAADKNKADVYVMLPDNFGDTVGAYTDRAEDILDRLETESENIGLPLPDQITAKILGALTALDNYANTAEGPGKVTNEQIKTRLNNYLTAIKDLYSTEKLVDKAGNVVDKVKDVLKNNETIQSYADKIKLALDEFKDFKNSVQTISVMSLRSSSSQSNEEQIAREFLNSFMDNADVNEDDVRALLSYVADYADNSSYKQDAITLIKTLGVIGKVETDKVNTAIDNVNAAFDTLKGDVKAKLLEINGRTDKVPTKADAKVVLGYVETFIKSVEEQAKAVVTAFTVQNIYFGIEPSAAGVYDCYAVNVSANYVPNLTTATLVINHVHTEGTPVTENEVDPDCVNDGSYDTVVYCTECGEELSRVTTVVPALGHTAGVPVRENEAADGSYDEVVYCSVCGAEISRTRMNSEGVPYVCLNMLTDVYYTDLSDALEEADNEAIETILMLQDYTEKYVVIAPGTTLDLADKTVTASFVIGMNGSYLIATPNSGKLVAPKANVTLSKEGYKNDADQYILPIWDPENSYYLFSKFVVNTEPNKNRGLSIDEASEHIRFQFKHQATGAINQSLLKNGADDNALKIIVRLTWNTGKGEAYQDFVYNDQFVGDVTGYNDYIFNLTGYSAMNIDLSTLKVTGMIITDGGATASGETWTKANTVPMPTE